MEVPAALAHFACARAPHPAQRLLEPGAAGARGTTAEDLGQEAESAARCDLGQWIRGPGQQERSWPGTSRGSIRFEDSEKNEVARDHLKEVAMTQAILDDTVELVLWTA